MKTTQIITILGVTGTVALLTVGCAERRVTTAYVPVYTVPPENGSQPTYVYNQAYYPSTGGELQPPPVPAYEQPVPTAPAIAQPSQATPLPPPPQPAMVSGTVVQTTAAPPPARVEVIPVAPGPRYVWVSGYWAWNRGAWVWVRGCWVARPRTGAVWVGGYWARHGHGYVWVGGRWR